jgi:hypothetical protein
MSHAVAVGEEESPCKSRCRLKSKTQGGGILAQLDYHRHPAIASHSNKVMCRTPTFLRSYLQRSDYIGSFQIISSSYDHNSFATTRTGCVTWRLRGNCRASGRCSKCFRLEKRSCLIQVRQVCFLTPRAPSSSLHHHPYIRTIKYSLY